MKVKELIEHLSSVDGNHTVVVELFNPEVFPSHAATSITTVWEGIDWDSGRVFLRPGAKLTKTGCRNRDEQLVMKREGRQHVCPVCLNFIAGDDWYCRYCGQRVKKEGTA